MRTHSNTPRVKNISLIDTVSNCMTSLTTRSRSLKCYLQPSTTLQKSIPKQAARRKPRKQLPWSIVSWNTWQDFLKIPSLWDTTLETERRCFSKVILESNIAPNITIGHQTSSAHAVLSIVNAGDWGCIVRYLETIIILVLLALNSSHKDHSTP